MGEKKYFWIIDWFLMVDFLYLIPPIGSGLKKAQKKKQSKNNFKSGCAVVWALNNNHPEMKVLH
jgi:hypothetical protein